jgi:hypothetical protein
VECKIFFSYLEDSNIALVVRCVWWRHLLLVQFVNQRIGVELKDKVTS